MNFDRAWPFLRDAFILGYVIGAVPFGLLLARAFGVGDIRRKGSGNIGAMNMTRIGGWPLGLATLLLDMAKGAAPMLIVLHVWEYGPTTAAPAGFGAFVGHCFSVFLLFSGGKGVATAFGVFLVWSWEIALMCAGVWLIVALVTRISSVASLSAAAAAALLFPLSDDWTSAWFVFAMGLITLFRHAGNIRRLLNGAEPRIALGRRRAAAHAADDHGR